MTKCVVWRDASWKEFWFGCISRAFIARYRFTLPSTEEECSDKGHLECHLSLEGSEKFNFIDQVCKATQIQVSSRTLKTTQTKTTTTNHTYSLIISFISFLHCLIIHPRSAITRAIFERITSLSNFRKYHPISGNAPFHVDSTRL